MTSQRNASLFTFLRYLFLPNKKVRLDRTIVWEYHPAAQSAVQLIAEYRVPVAASKAAPKL